MRGVELANKRVTTLMTATEKALLEDKAKRAGISVSEYVRFAVDAFDPEDVAQLAVLAVELERSNRVAAEALDRALTSVEETLAQLQRRSPENIDSLI